MKRGFHRSVNDIYIQKKIVIERLESWQLISYSVCQVQLRLNNFLLLIMMDSQHTQVTRHQFVNMLTPEDVMTLFEDNPYLNAYGATIENPVLAAINREMMPILAELVTLGPKNQDHPTVNQLFKWLVDPQRTGEEFHYVFGPLQMYVRDIMMEHFEYYMYEEDGYSLYLGTVAAEALAVKCPVLEGPWEHIAWLLVKESLIYHQDNYGPASDCLSAWIINMIGNADICSNPYLRFEFINILETRIDYNYFNHDGKTQVLESMLSACSFLTTDYNLDIHEYGGDFHKTDFFNITQIFRICVNDKYMMGFDEELALKLQHIQRSRLSYVIHTSLSISAANHNYCNQPNALHGLTALLKAISGCVQRNKDKFKKRDFIVGGGRFCGIRPLYGGIHSSCLALHELIKTFPKSCQTAQLVEPIAFCLFNLLKTFIFIKAEMINLEMDPNNFYDINMLLRLLLENDISIIPIVLYIIENRVQFKHLTHSDIILDHIQFYL